MSDVSRRQVNLAAGCFLLGACGAGVFAAAYTLDWGTPVLGGSIGGALAFIALGLALWSRQIEVSHDVDFVEPRGVGPTPLPEFDRFYDRLTEQPVPRSGMLWLALGGSLGALGLAGLFPLRSLFPSMKEVPADILSQSPWKKDVHAVTEEGAYVKPDDLETGGVLTVYPEGYDRRLAAGATLLIRLDPANLALPPSRRGWDVDGVIAYSKICTHAGCPVGLYAEESHQLLCPCHHSIFDATRAAKPVEGPASHPLPQVPLSLDAEGYLVAAGPFTGPVGAAWWGRP